MKYVVIDTKCIAHIPVLTKDLLDTILDYEDFSEDAHVHRYLPAKILKQSVL